MSSVTSVIEKLTEISNNNNNNDDDKNNNNNNANTGLNMANGYDLKRFLVIFVFIIRTPNLWKCNWKIFCTLVSHDPESFGTRFCNCMKNRLHLNSFEN